MTDESTNRDSGHAGGGVEHFAAALPCPALDQRSGIPHESRRWLSDVRARVRAGSLTGILTIPNLTWRFALTAAVLGGALGMLLNSALGDVVTGHSLEEARRDAEDIVGKQLLMKLTPEDFSTPMTGDRLVEFQRYVHERVLSSRALRVKIWGPNGDVIYSDEPSAIGQRFAIGDDLAHALAGHTSADVKRPHHAEENATERGLGTLIEVYAPLLFAGAPAPAGAFEVYEAYEPTAQALVELRNKLTIGLAGGFVVLYLALLRVVHGGTRMIRNQALALQGHASELERANEALHDSEARFRSMVTHASEVVLLLHPDGRIQYAGASVQELWGYAPDEVEGTDAYALVHFEDRDRLARALSSCEPGQYVTASFRVRRADGSVQQIEATGTNLLTEPAVGGIVLNCRDVTERLRFEEERERAREEQQAARERLHAQLSQSQRLESLGQLAGGVAHDFNNLLTVIMNYATFAADTVAEEHVAQPANGRLEAVRHDLQQIVTASERAARLTHQLLAFARRQAITPEAIDLNAITRDLQEMLTRTLGSQVRIEYALSPDLWPIEADRGQLEQIIINLAVNARDAMSDRADGLLSVETSNFLADEEYANSETGVTPGEYVRLRISDTGSGMPPEVMSRAFEPFFTTKTNGRGSGLGLATVYGIVAQSGGHVQLYSLPDVGTTVTVMLPALRGDVCPESAEDPGIGGNETVLLVEDEAPLREAARRILMRNGYEVLVAESGEQALATAAAYPRNIDVLLTDVVMPSMGGPEVAARLAALRPEARVLYMSGYAEPIMTAQGTLQPSGRAVPKPFSAPVLLQLLRETIAGGRDSQN